MERQLIQKEYNNKPIVPEESSLDSSVGLGGKIQDAGVELLQRATIFGAASKTAEYEKSIPSKIESAYISDVDGKTDEEILSDVAIKVEELKKNKVDKDTYTKLLDQGIPRPLLYKALKDKPRTQYELLYNIEKYKDLERADRNIAENAGAADYLTMVIAAFADIDSIATGGAGVFLKTAKVGSQLGDIAEAGSNIHKAAPVTTTVAAGAAYAGTNQALINHFGEDSNSDAVKNSALWGAGIGGTLGWLSKTSNKFATSNKYVEDTDGVKVTKGEYLQKSIDKLQENIDTLNTKADLEKQVKAQDKAKIVRQLDELKVLRDTAKADLKKVSVPKKELETTRNNLVKEQKKLTEAIDSQVAKDSELSKLAKEKKALTESPIVNKKALKEVEKRIAKLKRTKDKNIDELNYKLSVVNKNIEDNTLKLDEAMKVYNEILGNVDTATKAVKESPTVKGESHDTYRSLELDNTPRAKLEAINKQLEGTTSEDLQTAFKQGQDELASGNPIGSKQVIVDRQTKLKEDLEDYLDNPLSLDRLKEIPMYDHIVTAMEKYAPKVSPITRLYASENPAARAIAALMSPPVVATKTFVNNLTAKTYIRDMRIEVNDTLMKINNDFEDYIKAGGEPMTVVEYFAKVEKERLISIGKQHRDMIKLRSNVETGSEDISKILREARNEMKFKFEHKDPYITKSMNRIEDYFSTMGNNGRQLKITNLMDTAKGGYGPQLYSEKVARSMGEDEFVEFLTNAQKRYALDNSLPINEESFRASAKTAHYHALSENQRYEQNFKEFSPHTPTSISTGKQRSIQIYADDMAQLQDDNTILNMITYSRAMGGKFALKKFLNIEKKIDIVPSLKAAGIGENTTEMKDLSALIDTVAGYREAPRYADDWEKYLHGASTVASMLHTMGFGIASATEITSVVANTGFINTVESLIPSWKATKRAYTGKLTDEDILEMSILRESGNHKFGAEVNRMETEGDLGIQSKAQAFGDTVTHNMAYLSGMTFLTDWFKSTGQTAGKKWILKTALADKVSTANAKRMAQNGISPEDLKTIKDSLYTDGKFTGYNENRLSRDMLDRLDRATLNIAHNSVLHPDGFTLPRVQTEGSDKLTRTLNNSILKFMRFPIASYEALLLNGLSTADAQQAMAAVLNAGMWSQILLAKDALNNWGENSDKRRYDLDSEKGKTKLLTDSLAAMSPTGGLSVLGNFASQLTTGETLSGFSAPLGSNLVVKDLQDITNGGINLNIYGIRLMKTLENLDYVNRTTKASVSMKSEYDLNLFEE